MQRISEAQQRGRDAKNKGGKLFDGEGNAVTRFIPSAWNIPRSEPRSWRSRVSRESCGEETKLTTKFTSSALPGLYNPRPLLMGERGKRKRHEESPGLTVARTLPLIPGTSRTRRRLEPASWPCSRRPQRDVTLGARGHPRRWGGLGVGVEMGR